MGSERSQFEGIYARNWQTVWLAARRIVTCDDDADDVTEWVFVRLWREGPEAWQRPLRRAFFERAGCNEALEFVKQRQRFEPLDMLPDLVALLLKPDEMAERRELIDCVRSSIDRLPPRCRSVMQLVAAGLTRAEIAGILGISPKAVEKQITHGRSLLRTFPALQRIAGTTDRPQRRTGGESRLNRYRSDGRSPKRQPARRYTNLLYVGQPTHHTCNSIAAPNASATNWRHEMKPTADTIRRSYPLQLSISLLAAAVLTGACGDANEPPRSAWEGIDSSATIPLLNASSICQQCIHLQRIVVLGDTIGPGYVEHVQDVIRDRRDRYWVAGTGAVKVFDHLGRHVRTVGRRGRGPLEFDFPRPVYSDATGNVHILDPPDETIVDAAMRLVEIRRLPGSVEAMAPFPDSDRYVVNMWSRTDSLIGLPLHIVDGSEIIHSFGVSPTNDTRPMTAFSSRRVVAVGRNGRVYSATWYDYLIELWTSSGRRIIGFEGPVLNSVEVLPGRNTLENPPPNQIMAIQEDALGRLWVLTSERRRGWQDAVREVVDERGRIGLALKEGRSVYDGRIDVIDVSTATIVATWQGEARLVSFVDDGLALEDHSLEDGTPQLVVWRVELESK